MIRISVLGNVEILHNALRVDSRIRLLQRHNRIEIGGVGVPLESLG